MRQQLVKEKAQRLASCCLIKEFTAFRARQLWKRYFRHIHAINVSWASF